MGRLWGRDGHRPAQQVVLLLSVQGPHALPRGPSGGGRFHADPSLGLLGPHPLPSGPRPHLGAGRRTPRGHHPVMQLLLEPHPVSSAPLLGGPGTQHDGGALGEGSGATSPPPPILLLDFRPPADAEGGLAEPLMWHQGDQLFETGGPRLTLEPCHAHLHLFRGLPVRGWASIPPSHLRPQGPGPAAGTDHPGHSPTAASPVGTAEPAAWLARVCG